MARHVPVILGSGVTATCASIGAAVAAAGPVEFCMSPGYAPPPPNSIRVCQHDDDRFVGARATHVRQAAQLSAHRICRTALDGRATGIASAAVYAAALKQPDLREIEMVADERISNSEISAAAQMAKIKAARPDVLYTSTTGTLFSTVMRGMSDVGLSVPVITTTANANLPQLKSLADVLPHEVFFNGFALRLGDQLRDKNIRDQIAAFNDAFKQIGVTPTDTNALGWDELLLTLAGFRQFGPAMTAEQLKTFVLGQRHFAGMNGYYDFSTGDQHGLGSDAVVVIVYDKDKGDFYPASQPGGIPLKR